MLEVSIDSSILLNAVQVKTLKLCEGIGKEQIGLPEPQDGLGAAPSRSLEPGGVCGYREMQIYILVMCS